MAKINIKTSEKVMPMIYAYTTPGVSYHDGWIKIGYTERDVDERIKEQTKTANIRAKKEWQDIAIFADGKTRFTDKEFHNYLIENNIERMGAEKDDEGCPEWFKISGTESYSLFSKFRMDKGLLESIGVLPYSLREEQKRAVDETLSYFLNSSNEPEFLWNAKPRFGKTLATYDLCKKLKADKVLIVTNRPSIANSWYQDYVMFLGSESGYYFVTNVESLKNRKYVLTREQYTNIIARDDYKGCIEFISLQDLKGSLFFGGQYNKLEEVAKLQWDILVIDEAHEGVDTYKTDVAFDQIKRKYTLHLSGTPFKALANEKFKANAIFNWTYADEQEHKINWDNSSEEENPYFNLPKLNMYTYKMSDIVQDKIKQGADLSGDESKDEFYWDLNEFFKTNANGAFIHDEEVDKFLYALVNQEKFPFSTPALRDELKHTLWLMKYVSSAKALAKKLSNHPVFKDEYQIVLAAGDGKLDNDGEALDEVSYDNNLKSSYDKVVNAIKKCPKTITISVGQLTTGITIPEWTGVMMLYNGESPSLYMQAAFRVQNPCLFDGPNGIKLRKQNAYVFDFDPARTLDFFEQFANGLHSETVKGRGDADTRKKHVRELINYFPVYGEDDNGEMIELNAENVLSIPRALHAREVVRRGFMSNFLFQNIGNIFNAPKEIIDLIQGFEPVREPVGISQNTKDELDIDENGDVATPKEKIIGTADNIFGGKIYGSVQDALVDTIDNIQKTQSNNPKKDDKLDKILDAFHTNITENLVETAKEKYTSDMSKATEQRVIRKINNDTDTFVKKEYGNYKIKCNKLENERESAIEEAKRSSNLGAVAQINKTYDDKKKTIDNDFISELQSNLQAIIENAGYNIVEAVETDKKEKNRNELMENVKDHLRGFSRTIPSFLMAYGNQTTTLENFDKVIPNDVFKEVTGVSLAEFIRLRDGFDYVDDDGESHHYNGFFDSVVFNDSIKEFLSKKEKLSNYFEEGVKEDIFDYIPPQKTNQIFTPKKVVKKMVDDLEKENPGCFDNPNHTFMDLYMKSGLFIAEIVKRLYQSDEMKKHYPNNRERLNHIFEKQVYGLAPTEIIYRISIAYILGFGEHLKINQHNFRQVDSYPYAQNGTLERELDKIYHLNR